MIFAAHASSSSPDERSKESIGLEIVFVKPKRRVVKNLLSFSPGASRTDLEKESPAQRSAGPVEFKEEGRARLVPLGRTPLPQRDTAGPETDREQ